MHERYAAVHPSRVSDGASGVDGNGLPKVGGGVWLSRTSQACEKGVCPCRKIWARSESGKARSLPGVGSPPLAGPSPHGPSGTWFDRDAEPLTGLTSVP